MYTTSNGTNTGEGRRQVMQFSGCFCTTFLLAVSVLNPQGYTLSVHSKLISTLSDAMFWHEGNRKHIVHVKVFFHFLIQFWAFVSTFIKFSNSKLSSFELKPNKYFFLNIKSIFFCKINKVSLFSSEANSWILKTWLNKLHNLNKNMKTKWIHRTCNSWPSTSALLILHIFEFNGHHISPVATFWQFTMAPIADQVIEH